MKSINKKYGVNNKNNKQKKQHSIKDLLCNILATAPVFHFETSELKADAD